MGEGKSSVIVPMVATSLADGHLLVRVLVLKPLAASMFQLLADRLGGLVNRRVFYLPFSRDVMIDFEGAQRIRQLYELCAREKGILVAQPEHILSFKLMGIDLGLKTKGPIITQHLTETQHWLERMSRDVLDESDEILHVRYQLVYSIGKQSLLEEHPARWKITQDVLSLVMKHIGAVQKEYPDGLEVQSRRRTEFPLLRLLHANAGNKLIHYVALDILGGDYFCRLPPDIRQTALLFITRHDPTTNVERSRLIKGHCGDHISLWNTLLLLRGLLAEGILQFCLADKRFRVDFGLHNLGRTMLAVPYRAKDQPSPRADFGHPDVAITCTCLAYYYSGLTVSQLDACFNLLLKADSPTAIYEVISHCEIFRFRFVDNMTALDAGCRYPSRFTRAHRH